MVYVDDCATAYVHKGGVNRELAARGYSALRHIGAPHGSPDQLRHDAALLQQQAPSSLRAHLMRATLQ